MLGGIFAAPLRMKHRAAIGLNETAGSNKSILSAAAYSLLEPPRTQRGLAIQHLCRFIGPSILQRCVSPQVTQGDIDTARRPLLRHFRHSYGDTGVARSFCGSYLHSLYVSSLASFAATRSSATSTIMSSCPPTIPRLPTSTRIARTSSSYIFAAFSA